MGRRDKRVLRLGRAEGAAAVSVRHAAVLPRYGDVQPRHRRTQPLRLAAELTVAGAVSGAAATAFDRRAQQAEGHPGPGDLCGVGRRRDRVGDLATVIVKRWCRHEHRLGSRGRHLRGRSRLTSSRIAATPRRNYSTLGDKAGVIHADAGRHVSDQGKFDVCSRPEPTAEVMLALKSATDPEWTGQPAET